ncbi:hypothetical protein D3C81_1958880 [compost metagenome]
MLKACSMSAYSRLKLQINCWMTARRSRSSALHSRPRLVASCMDASAFWYWLRSLLFWQYRSPIWLIADTPRPIRSQ